MTPRSFSRRGGCVELLEGRRLLTVAGVPSGDIIITGTEGDDVVEVAGSGAGAVITVNGSVTPVTGPINNLDIDGLGGADRIFLHDLTITEDLSVAGSAGNDDVRVFRTTAGGDVDIDTDTGDDFVFITDVQAGDDASFRTGAGNDRMTLTRTQAVDDITLLAESGDDVAIVGFLTAQKVKLIGGGGNDLLGTNAATITGRLVIAGWENVHT
jgi:hypothetical protein